MHSEKIVRSVRAAALQQTEAQATILQLNKTLESDVVSESGRSPCNKSPCNARRAGRAVFYSLCCPPLRDARSFSPFHPCYSSQSDENTSWLPPSHNDVST